MHIKMFKNTYICIFYYAKWKHYWNNPPVYWICGTRICWMPSVTQIQMPKLVVFLVRWKISFEIGKSAKQLHGLSNAFVVKDNIAYPTGRTIPLWMFGLLY